MIVLFINTYFNSIKLKADEKMNRLKDFFNQELFTTAYKITVAVIANLMFWGLIEIISGLIIYIFPSDLIGIDSYAFSFLIFQIIYLFGIISSTIILILLVYKEIKQMSKLIDKEFD